MERCLDVGLRICGSESTHYVDDIPAISSQLVKVLKDEEKQTFSEYFTKLKDAAYTKFLLDVQMEFQKSKSFNAIVAETPPFSADRVRNLFSDQKVIGYRQMLPFHRFVTYYVDSLGFYVHTAGNIEILIIDLVTNEILQVIPHTLVKGLNDVKVDIEIKNEYQSDIFVGIRNISAVLSSMKCAELTDCNCDYTCDCEYDYGVFTNSVFNKEELDYQEHQYFCLNASVKCSFEAIICAYAIHFQSAYKWAVAVQILEAKLNTSVRGWFADSNVQTVREFTLPETIAYYDGLVQMGVNAIKGITNDSICWSCEGTINGKPQMESYV